MPRKLYLNYECVHLSIDACSYECALKGRIPMAEVLFCLLVELSCWLYGSGSNVLMNVACPRRGLLNLHVDSRSKNHLFAVPYTSLVQNVCDTQQPALCQLPPSVCKQPISTQVNNVSGYSLILARFVVASQRLVLQITFWSGG